MVGDLDHHKISSVPNFNSVQNFRPLGSVKADNSYNGIGREGVRELGTFCMLSRVASQLENRIAMIIVLYINNKIIIVIIVPDKDLETEMNNNTVDKKIKSLIIISGDPINGISGSN